LLRFYRDNRYLYFFETGYRGGQRTNSHVDLYRLKINGAPEEKPYFSAITDITGKKVRVDLMGNRFLPGAFMPFPEGKRIPADYKHHKGRGVLHAFIDYLKESGFEEVEFDKVRSTAPYEELQKRFGIPFEAKTTYEKWEQWGLPEEGDVTRVKIKLK